MRSFAIEEPGSPVPALYATLGTDFNSGDQFYQFQPYYCHPPQVSSLVLPRVYLASDFKALLEELDEEIGQQLAEM